MVDGVPIFAKTIVHAGDHRQRTIFSGICNANCESYRTSEDYEARAIQNWKKMSMVRGANMTPGDLVLDVGCSDGFWLRLLSAQYQTQGIGVDLADSIFVATQQDHVLGLNNRFCLSEAELLPFDDQTVDVVVTFDLLEHLPKPEVALGEMVRVLKPGGRLLIHMPVSDYDYTLLAFIARFFPRYFRSKAEAIGHFYHQIISSQQLKEILECYDLRILTLEKFGGWVQPIHDWYILTLFGRVAHFVRRGVTPEARADQKEAQKTPLAARPVAATERGVYRWIRSGYRAALSILRLAFLSIYFLIDWPLSRLGIGYTIYVLAEKTCSAAHSSGSFAFLHTRQNTVAPSP